MKWFPPFRADLAAGTVWRGETRLPLTHKAFALLRCLIERPGRVVTRETLLETVWADTHVHPGNVKALIAEIRRALREDPANPAYIRTVPKRGYAFIGPVIDAPPGQATPTTSHALVGRQAAVDALHAALGQASTGTRRVVFVTGPVGIGKTALVENFLASPTKPTIRATWARCTDRRVPSSPYATLFDAIARLLRSVDGMTVFDSLARHAPSWLARLQAPPARRPLIPFEGQPASGGMVREIVTALESIASTLPLVLWLDDLHYADLATIDVLASLGRRSDPARLLIIGTMWPLESLRPASILRRVTASLVSLGPASVHDLVPLTEPEVERYLATRFDAGPVSDAAGTFHRATGGNPLLLVTAVDHLVAAGQIAPDERRWRLTLGPEALDAVIPASLAGMMSQQLATLTPDERTALEAASIVGMEPTLWAVSAATGVDELALEPVFRALERRGTFVAYNGADLNPGGIPTVVYRFHHGLCRDVILREMSDAVRTGFHRRLGAAFEREFAGREDAAALELARHFAGAGDDARAVRYFRIAARDAERRGAGREAVALLHGAARGADRISGGDADDQRLAIGLDLADAQLGAGEPAAAFTTLSRVARAAAADRDAAMKLRAVLGLARASFGTDRAGCLERIREARTLAGALPAAPIAAAARVRTGVMEIQLAGWSDAIADDCLASWKTLPASACDERRSAAIDLLVLDDLRSAYARAVRSGRRLVAAAERVGRLAECLNSRRATSIAALHCGRLGDAVNHAAEGLVLAERAGNTGDAALLQLQQAWIAIETQQWEHALELSLVARQLDARPGGQAIQMARLFAALAYTGLGRHTDAETELDDLRARYERERLVMDWYWRIPLHLALVDLALRRRDPARGQAEAAAAVALATATPERTLRSRAHVDSSRAALAAGDVSRAEREINLACREIAGIEAPLAGWRVEEARAALLERKGQFESAHRARRLARQTLDRLKASRANDAGTPDLVRDEHTNSIRR